MRVLTADLCDLAGKHVQVAEPGFESFGAVTQFAGVIVTLRLFEDNTLLRNALQTDGAGRVLVIDGGASTRTALLGGMLAQLAVDNHWQGVVINGAVRDRVELRQIDLGILALASVPRRSSRTGEGESDVPLHFANVDFKPGEFVYVDEDGLIVSASNILTGSGNSR